MKLYPLKIAVRDGPLLNAWHTDNNHKSVIFFTHGNGFSSRVYEPMLKVLAQHHDLLLLDLPGHGLSATHEFVGWRQTAEFVNQAIAQSHAVTAGRNVYAVAHSLGGMLSILAASANPKLFKSMVLLDPIMFPTSLMLTMRALKTFGMIEWFHPMVKATQRRRNGWVSREEAFKYFHQRKIFKHWTDESLESYVQHALKDDGDQVRLCCAPELEVSWYLSLPGNQWSAIRQLSIPVSIFMGQESYPFSLRACKRAVKINNRINLDTVAGDHCFMQAQPAMAADCVLDKVASIGERLSKIRSNTIDDSRSG